MSRASVLAAALQLPVEERAKLVTELIDAVEDEPAEDPTVVEQAWATELEARIARADAHPEDAIEWDDLPRHRFPFTIVFRVPATEDIEILAVAHTRRSPGYWRDRTRWG